MLGRGGIEDGSAVGLVKKVAELGLNSNPVINKEELAEAVSLHLSLLLHCTNKA